MGSHNYGKTQVVSWIRNNFRQDSEILDVGFCDGVWRNLLPDYPNMDGVEVFEPNYNRCKDLYRQAFLADIRELEYKRYDLIIFGDVIEHMPTEDAQRVLTYANERCKDMVIAVPFLYEQGEIYGNKYERHIQDDLTAAIFKERYPGYEVLFDTQQNYCYYHKGRDQR